MALEELGLRSIWEDFEVELETDVDLDVSINRYFDYDCKHMHEGIVPRVVIAYNEGGYNSVGICADCLIEALQRRGIASG